jgi:glycosyltransferase involved in cell wall biosynthesis
MKVVAFVPHNLDTTPAQRLRIEQWSRYWRHEGIETTFIPFSSPRLRQTMYASRNYGRKLMSVFEAMLRYGLTVRSLDLGRFDVAFVAREATLVGPPFVERYIVRQGLRFLYDFDDAIFLPYPSQKSPWFTVGRWYSKISEICQLSSHITVVNEYLRRYAQQHHQKVTVIPMGMAVDEVPRAALHQHHPSSDVVIGWTGSFSTSAYVEQLFPILRELQHTTGCTIHLMGTQPRLEYPGLTLKLHPWSPQTEGGVIAGFDIGINPMPVDDWSKGKGTGKTLQYMCYGVPVVATPVGSNIEIIKPGENGLFATSDQEWLDALRLLIADHQMRQSMGLRARSTIEQHFDIRHHALKLAQLLQTVATSNE